VAGREAEAWGGATEELRRQGGELLQGGGSWAFRLGNRLGAIASRKTCAARAVNSFKEVVVGLQVGQSVGRYRIVEQLGEGGMATVYKAYDTRLETEVALKVIRTEQFALAVLERVLRRFEREAKALASLTHPNIVKVT